MKTNKPQKIKTPLNDADLGELIRKKTNIHHAVLEKTLVVESYGEDITSEEFFEKFNAVDVDRLFKSTAVASLNYEASSEMVDDFVYDLLELLKSPSISTEQEDKEYHSIKIAEINLSIIQSYLAKKQAGKSHENDYEMRRLVSHWLDTNPDEKFNNDWARRGISKSAINRLMDANIRPSNGKEYQEDFFRSCVRNYKKLQNKK